MISLLSDTNLILQLNISEEKLFIIISILTAALTDEKKLVQIIILKLLLTQMFHVLLKKLDDMLSRCIFHILISQSVWLNVHNVREIWNLCKECMCTDKILLIQSKHLLLFELMSLKWLLFSESELSNVLIKTQCWLKNNSHDIFNESDEILSVCFELVYIMSTQYAIEFSLNWWIIIEHVLELVNWFAQSVLQHFL